MNRMMFALLVSSLTSGSSWAQQSIVGTYKMVSQVREAKGSAPTENMGKSPRGHMTITPTIVVLFYTAESRKPGTTDAEKIALYETLGGWSGRYRIEGSKLIVRLDSSWNEAWTGKEQVRNFQLSGKRLTFTTDPQPGGRDPSQTVVIRQVWEKVE